MIKEFLEKAVYSIGNAVIRVKFHAEKKALPGVKDPVIVVKKSAKKLSITAVDKKAAEKSLQLLGGCLVSHVREEELEAAFAAKLIPEWAYAVTKGLPDYYQVILCAESLEGLSDEEVKAIYLHEIGHIVNGDLHVSDVNRIGNIIANDEFEFAADDYAAEIVGKAAMKSALEKVVGNLIKFLNKEGTYDEVKNAKEELQNPSKLTQRRLERLS